MQGQLIVITGGMFSGKTEELIRMIKRYTFTTKRVGIFKPAIDNRYSIDKVVTHDKKSFDSITINHSHDIIQYIEDVEKLDVIGIDEIQFFTDDIVDTCNYLLRLNKHIIVAGLDMSYNGNPFGPMPKLMAIADDVKKVHAVCIECSSPAVFSYKKQDNDNIIEVGESDIYEPLCRKCYYNKIDEKNYL